MEEEKDEGWYGGWTVAAEGARPQGLERLRQVAEHNFKIIRVLTGIFCIYSNNNLNFGRVHCVIM